jgi:hypothetical protein
VKPYLDWRGARLEGAAWQGIHHLTMTLGPHPGDGSPRGATMTVHLEKPADGLAAHHVRVTGGQRVRSLKYAVRFPVDGSGSRIAQLAIDFEAIGDHSTYTVSLLSGGAYALHPFFASADFVFLIDCETGDCRAPTGQASRSAAPAPAIDLVTKDYTGFLSLLADRIRVSNPHWADLSPASFERVLVDLLAHQGDMLSYYQDRVANEGFLETATQRFSVWQHGVLLGYELFDGVAASTILGFWVSSSGYVPARLMVRMEERPGEAPVVFSVRSRTRVEPENNLLIPAAWPGAPMARIPAGETRMLLWGHGYKLRAGQRIAFVQGAFHQLVALTAVREVEQPGWVERPEDPLVAVDQKVTEIAWGPSDRLERALHPWQLEPPILDAHEYEAQRLRIYGNLVEAVHGEHRVAWLNPTSAPRRQDVVMSLDEQGSIVSTVSRGDAQVRLLRALRVPEGPVLFDEDANGERTLALDVTINDRPWYAQEHLHGSRSYDRHYVATTAEDGSAWLHFGDGVRGHEVRVEPAGSAPRIVLRYRVGEPIAGNCAPGTITRVIAPEDPTSDEGIDYGSLGTVLVTNVVPGSGGRGPESLDVARQAIPTSLRRGAQQRAVTLRDYADAAEQVRGVARATVRVIGGSFSTLLLLIDPEGQEELDPVLERAVFSRLDSMRMVGRELRVAAPIYVPLDIELAICAEPGWQRHEVRDRLYAALRPGTRERPGLFHPDNLSFAEAVELGEVLAYVQGIPGVRSVKAFTFRPLRSAHAAKVVPRIRLDTTEVARLDADPSYPENGRLVIRVEGLDSLLSGPAYSYAIDVPPSEGA